MIKILTGWSNKGGSTFAFIRLTNALNDAGYEAKMYGPHDWHLDKCKSDKLDNFKPEPDDTLIIHFLALPDRPPVKKVVLNCHEKDVYEVSRVVPFWDECIFLNEKQRKYHSAYTGSYVTIPNLKEPLPNSIKEEGADKCAGVIGSIDKNKQTHISILRAINDGYDKVYIFGNVTDQQFYENEVKPIIEDNKDKIIEYGFISDKEKMYNMIDAVYLSSKSEVASLVKDECETNGTKFFGNHATNHDTKDLTNEEIIKEWVKVLEL
tara:strand:+ start:2448 stop:3242 length:795 start_codon:yes stop_codon:yes gene_type:complete